MFLSIGTPQGEPTVTLQMSAQPICLLGQKVHLLYSSVMYNSECLRFYVWPQHSNKASACDGVAIISHVGLGEIIQDQSWPLVRPQNLDKALS